MWLKLLSGKMSRATVGSAGFDLFLSGERVIVPSGGRCTLSTGVVTSFEPGYCACLWDKSGLAHRAGLTLLGGLIDADYDQEWKVICLNTGVEPLVFNPGDRVAQVVFLRFEYPTLISKGDDAEFLLREARREGGFGSTGV